MNAKEKAYKIAKEKMFDNDAFSQWLGIKIIELDQGYAKLQMQLRQEMTQGFGIAHGAISYALADSALAFAANTHGQQSLSVETSISHTKAVHPGDVLTATAIEEHLSHKIGIYKVNIVNQKDEIVALFKGTVYRTSKIWKIENEVG